MTSLRSPRLETSSELVDGSDQTSASGGGSSQSDGTPNCTQLSCALERLKNKVLALLWSASRNHGRCYWWKMSASLVTTKTSSEASLITAASQPRQDKAGQRDGDSFQRRRRKAKKKAKKNP